MAKPGPKGPISTSFKKGQVANPNGRPKGSQNKSTKVFKEVMQALLDANEGNFETWIKRIARNDPDAAIGRLLQAAEFVAPKLSRLTHTGDVEEPVFFKQVEDNVPADPGTGTSN